MIAAFQASCLPDTQVIHQKKQLLYKHIHYERGYKQKLAEIKSAPEMELVRRGNFISFISDKFISFFRVCMGGSRVD